MDARRLDTVLGDQSLGKLRNAHLIEQGTMGERRVLETTQDEVFSD
jgi:hypothetical protein